MKSITHYITESNNDSFTFDKTSKQTVTVEYKYNYKITVNDYSWKSDDTGKTFDLTKEDPNEIYQEYPTGKLSIDLDVEFDLIPSTKVESGDENDLFDEVFTSEDFGESVNGWFEMEYDGHSNDINGDLEYSDYIKWTEILEKFAKYYQDEYIQEYIIDISRNCR